MSDTPKDTELREQIYDLCYDLKHSLWTAEPDRTVNKLMKLLSAHSLQERNELFRARADLATCLGILRGLGHPEVRLEKQYDLEGSRENSDA